MKPPLPGDLSREDRIARMLRVDHAGEHGAVRIYEGQLAVLGNRPVGAVIRRMAKQEQAHLETFDRMLPERRVRPTLLSPLWSVAGFALGAATAMLAPSQSRK
jgi:3-demethoxyubiquinol 3-hydroxylase